MTTSTNNEVAWRATIHLNNTGVFLLDHGLYLQAHEVMRDAVTVLVQCVLFRQTYNPAQVQLSTVLQNAKQHLIKATTTTSPTSSSSSLSIQQQNQQQRSCGVVALSIADVTPSVAFIEQIMKKAVDNKTNSYINKMGDVQNSESFHNFNSEVHDHEHEEVNDDDADDEILMTYDEDDHEDDDDDDMLFMYKEGKEEGEPALFIYDDDDKHRKHSFVPVVFRIDTTESFCLNLYSCTIINNFATCMHCLAVYNTHESNTVTSLPSNGDTRNYVNNINSQRTNAIMRRVHSLLDLAHRAAFRSFETTEIAQIGSVGYNNQGSRCNNSLMSASDSRMDLAVTLFFVMYNMVYISDWLGMGNTKIEKYRNHSHTLHEVLFHMEARNIHSQSIGSGAA